MLLLLLLSVHLRFHPRNKKGNPEHVSLFNDVSAGVVIRAIKQAPGREERRREKEINANEAIK